MGHTDGRIGQLDHGRRTLPHLRIVLVISGVVAVATADPGMAGNSGNSPAIGDTVMYAVYELATGRLISRCSIAPNPRSGIGILEYEPPDPPELEVWDHTLPGWVTRPPKQLFDRLNDIITDPDYQNDFIDVWNRLLIPGDREKVTTGLNRLLGGTRYRSVIQPITIEPPTGGSLRA